jgi:hypothetical protein
MARTVQEEIDHINQMSRMSMGKLMRFGLAGHPYFDISKPYWEVFNKRFKELGGFTPAMSKAIGW